MKIVVIGGTGHIGTFLVPRLVAAGHDVTVVSRRRRDPYQTHDDWQQVAFVALDRTELEKQGKFGQAIADLTPDAVIDLISFELDSTRQLTDALAGRVRHFLHCGTIWVHGYNELVPVNESDPRYPIDAYGLRKAAIETYLLQEVDQADLPSTVIHPGHIVGPGWTPITPAGNLDARIFTKLATGHEVLLPNQGLETLHHVHADDVALGFMLALDNPAASIGESFHILSERAMTWRGYAQALATWYGTSANLRFVTFDEFKQTTSEEYANQSWGHLLHSTNGSITKARQRLGFHPHYTSMEAIQESLTWLKEQGRL
ncbi:NAD-dependent epimerase/dehydratase family protein [Spirosoma sp.]|uniref:NAD-dependent epimerase/dehydratase family protein n=1 Tax=Spirosoma sp. TaxID=1899569 RepID=UPI00260CBC07|nr:NAD-dependent epimerase/dehydratase family protein [Spirosoma sp.]MCX6214922.1 NAD-dependent epimerase/dehydratase family protein [Spirosoma sp.]